MIHNVTAPVFMKGWFCMKNVLRILAFLSAIAAILGILKLTSEALSLGTHKYFEVDSDNE